MSAEASLNPVDNQKEKLARTMGSTLWKWYEDLVTTIKPQATKKVASKKIPHNQISSRLDKREDDLKNKKNKFGV